MQKKHLSKNWLFKNFDLLNLHPAVSLRVELGQSTNLTALNDLQVLLQNLYIRHIYVSGASTCPSTLNRTILQRLAKNFDLSVQFNPDIPGYLADHPDQIDQILYSFVFSSEQYTTTGMDWGNDILHFYGWDPEILSLTGMGKRDLLPVSNAKNILAVYLLKNADKPDFSLEDITERLYRNKDHIIITGLSSRNKLLILRSFSVSFNNARHKFFNYMNLSHLNIVQHIHKAKIAQKIKSHISFFYDLAQILPLPYACKAFPVPGSILKFQPQLMGQIARHLSGLFSEETGNSGKVAYSHVFRAYWKELLGSALDQISDPSEFILPADHPMVEYLPADARFILLVDEQQFRIHTPYFDQTCCQIKRLASVYFSQQKNTLPVIYQNLLHTNATWQEKKYYYDHLFVRGANHIVMQMPGIEIDLVSDLATKDPNFPMYQDWFSYLHQLGNFLSDGIARPELLILYPSLNHDLSKFYLSLKQLERIGLGYEFMDYDMFNDDDLITIQDQHLDYLGKSYRIIVLPTVEIIPIATLQKLQRFFDQGGILIALGNLPKQGLTAKDTKRVDELNHELWFSTPAGSSTSFKRNDSGGRGYFLRDLQRLPDMIEELKTYIKLQVSSDQSCVLHTFRETQKTHNLFLLNTSDREVTCHIKSAYIGQPYVWDFEQMESQPCFRWSLDNNFLHITLPLNPRESKLILIDKNREPFSWQFVKGDIDGLEFINQDSRELNTWVWRRRIGKTSLQFIKGKNVRNISLQIKNRLPILNISSKNWFLESELYAGKGDLGDFSLLYPFYSGNVIYNKIILIEKEYIKDHKLILKLGRVADRCQVNINGKPAGRAFVPPWTFDISPYVKSGENKIQIKVFNTLSNQFVQKERYFNMQSYGLFGPVKIVPYRLVRINVTSGK